MNNPPVNPAHPPSLTPVQATVGIIIPPPDIRKLADKMAEFVAKNG